ncbi:MAG: hypothetical protein R3F11_17855 [Verrucomicrobiales bacterium]
MPKKSPPAPQPIKKMAVALVRRGDIVLGRAYAQQVLHRRLSYQRKDLLVEAVEQPAEAGDDEDEPVVAVQLVPPVAADLPRSGLDMRWF